MEGLLQGAGSRRLVGSLPLTRRDDAPFQKRGYGALQEAFTMTRKYVVSAAKPAEDTSTVKAMDEAFALKRRGP